MGTIENNYSGGNQYDKRVDPTVERGAVTDEIPTRLLGERASESFVMLPFRRPEVRKAHFLEAFDRSTEDMAILSFGKCNLACPYCKRDGQFKGEGNTIIKAQEYDWDFVKSTIDYSLNKGRRIRLSGGDPCMFPKESQKVAEYVRGTYDQKISVAHNGSSPSFLKKLLPNLEYAAIDIKGGSPEELAYRAGTRAMDRSVDRALECIELCASNGVLVDVRTCVFGDTSYDELERIRDRISGVDGVENVFWTLRKYNEIEDCEFVPGDPDKIRSYAESLAAGANFGIGFRDKWTGTAFQIWDKRQVTDHVGTEGKILQ